MNVLSDSSVYYNNFNYDIKVKITIEDYLMLLLKCTNMKEILGIEIMLFNKITYILIYSKLYIYFFFYQF